VFRQFDQGVEVCNDLLNSIGDLVIALTQNLDYLSAEEYFKAGTFNLVLQSLMKEGDL
jgi:hypothetical protein